MELAFERTGVMLTLRRGLNKGYWTVEDLDVLPPGSQLNLYEYKKYLVETDSQLQVPRYRNLLRDEDFLDTDIIL
jgi:hypothetical protein